MWYQVMLHLGLVPVDCQARHDVERWILPHVSLAIVPKRGPDILMPKMALYLMEWGAGGGPRRRRGVPHGVPPTRPLNLRLLGSRLHHLIDGRGRKSLPERPQSRK